MGLADVSDAELFEGVRGGDRRSWETLYRRARPRVVEVLLHLCGDLETAEDFAQEVFVRLWEQRERVAAAQAPIAYLLGMARNLWLNERQRRERFRRAVPSLVVREGRTESDEERRAAVQAAIGELEDDLREVLTLHRHGGLSYVQMAEMLGISVKTVEARMKRAFDALRARLKPFLEREM